MKQILLITAAALLLTACGTREVLLAKSPVVPDGIDLSGQWQLRRDSEATNQRLADAVVAAAGGLEGIFSTSGRNRSARANRDGDSLVHVFLETGSQLKITQTEFGLFISFDRAIVEEYRYGETTQVNVGPIIADRVSGWEEGAYVIETLDEEGNKLHERYLLEDGGAILVRQISIWKKQVLSLSVVQAYDRV